VFDEILHWYYQLHIFALKWTSFVKIGIIKNVHFRCIFDCCHEWKMFHFNVNFNCWMSRWWKLFIFNMIFSSVTIYTYFIRYCLKNYTKLLFNRLFIMLFFFFVRSYQTSITMEQKYWTGLQSRLSIDDVIFNQVLNFTSLNCKSKNSLTKSLFEQFIWYAYFSLFRVEHL
jgi:hypothetical protein